MTIRSDVRTRDSGAFPPHGLKPGGFHAPSYYTVIGADAGLALATYAPRVVVALPPPAFLAGSAPLIVGPVALPPIAAISLMLCSALLAVWPDIEEPGSFIARRVRVVLAFLGATLGLSAMAALL